jgi:hypothetical protein
MDSVSDSFGSGARTFLGDGGIDLFLGTGNSSYTPANTYIALNHSGEISMGAGAGTKHLVINTSGNVGIGTSSAIQDLHVYAEGNGDGILIESDPAGVDRAPALKLYPKSTSANVRNWAISPYKDIYQSLSFASSDAKGGDPYSAGTTRMIIDGISGNVGINTTSPSYKLDVDGGSTTGAAFRATKQASATDGLVAYFTNSSNGGYSSYIYIGSNPGTDWKIGKNISNPSVGAYHFEIADSSNNVRLQILNNNGNAVFSSDVIAYGSPSDARLKTIKEKIPNALDKIMKLNGYRFDWNEVNKTTKIKEDIGVIAQEVVDVLPELARTNEDGFMSVRYQGLTAVLIEAIKELKTEVEDLKYLLSQK